ncbi:MAG: hypothetical protein JWN93_726 [Hyphomicrobiales bacterium]|nr:hypothetical protein [Hyphomicrobiales bacterium]
MRARYIHAMTRSLQALTLWCALAFVAGAAFAQADPPRAREPDSRPRAERETRGAPQDRSRARAPDAARPIAPIDEQAGRKRVLDDLFARLAKAADPEEGRGVAGAIERVFMRSGSDTADLLMSRARSAMQDKKSETALDVLDKLVELEPEWPEAWHQRATARYLAGDRGGAVADLGRTLALEPRHFSALAGLGSILHASGFDKRALEVIRKALEVYPQQEELKTLAEQLAPDVDGRDI